MDKIIECVPNFSEGKDEAVINSIVQSINSIKNVKVLHVDQGYDAHRTVITFAGSPDGIAEASFRSIKTASELIDMSKHQGVHPRIGAVDVFPFIPVSGVQISECIEISNIVAEKVAKELGISVYMYEESAKYPERKRLSTIRNGEYENLPKKIIDPFWKPDYGPAVFNEKFGAMVMGAREFLIAYNVNLNTYNLDVSKRIAENLRESGYFLKDNDGNPVYDQNGQKVIQKGKFQYLKAIGWNIKEYNCSQISMNITRYSYTPIHVVFEACKKEAQKYGLDVNGSELIGMVPKEAIIQAGLFYIQKNHLSKFTKEEDIIKVAVESLGLSSVQFFDPQLKILEYRLQNLFKNE